jgi:hypothetical protein
MSERTGYTGAHMTLAFLAGAVAGAAAAAFLASEAGRPVRERLQAWGREIGGQAAARTGAAKDALGRVASAARDAYARATTGLDASPARPDEADA